jgi:hypothetical protein
MAQHYYAELRLYFVIYAKRRIQVLYAEYTYAKCLYAECHYAECRSVEMNTKFFPAESRDKAKLNINYYRPHFHQIRQFFSIKYYFFPKKRLYLGIQYAFDKQNEPILKDPTH